MTDADEQLGGTVQDIARWITEEAADAAGAVVVILDENGGAAIGVWTPGVSDCTSAHGLMQVAMRLAKECKCGSCNFFLTMSPLSRDPGEKPD